MNLDTNYDVPYMILNGLDTRNYNVIVRKLPNIPKAKRKFNTFTIDGRDGSIHEDLETYESMNVSVTCTCLDSSQDSIDKVKSLLKESGEVTFSNIPGRKFNYIITNQIDFSIYLKHLKEFPVQFELQPFSKGETVVVDLTESQTITNAGTYKVYPKITATGTGTLSINNEQIVFNESGVTVDCENMVIYKDLTNKADTVDLSDFPYLAPGSNSINLGTLTSVKLVYEKRYI